MKRDPRGNPSWQPREATRRGLTNRPHEAVAVAEKRLYNPAQSAPRPNQRRP
ncbi:hypothetical protein [Azospirillum argentinense]